MFYRENGQFKTSYRSDQQIFPILQDRIAIGLLLAFAFVAVPLLASDYLFRAILIPFLIFSLAAVGVARAQTLSGAALDEIIGASIGVVVSVIVHVAFWVTLAAGIGGMTAASTIRCWERHPP